MSSAGLGTPALSLTLAMGVIGTACVSDTGVPPAERRAQQLNKAIMCPVCPGESIDQSQNALAVQMRGMVSEKLQEGWQDAEIKSFFVERYGPSVLLEPPRSGLNLAVWVLPPVAVGGAILALYVVMRLMRRPRGTGWEEFIEGTELTEEERVRYFPLVDAAYVDRTAAVPGPLADDAPDNDTEGPG